MITIVDVAKEAGVSVATVSRVLNKNYSVTQEKKNLVMSAIEKTGYVIPERITSPVKTAEGSIVLIITSSLIERIMDAIQDTAKKAGFQTLSFFYRSTDDFPELEKLVAILRPSISGMILINAVAANADFENLVGGFPLVQIGPAVMKNHQNYSVYTDEITMSYDAADHLIKSGRKNIGFLSFEPDSENLLTLKKRENGYFLALLEHNMAIDYHKRIYTDISAEGGYEATRKLLQEYPDMDAIICITGCVAEGCIHALLEIQNPVTTLPFSLDYSELFDISAVSCPYMDPQSEKLGAASVEFLLDLIEKKGITDCERVVPYQKNIKR